MRLTEHRTCIPVFLQEHFRALGTGIHDVQNSQNGQAEYGRRTKLTKTVRQGMEAEQKTVPATGFLIESVPVPPVTVREAYRTHRTIGYR